MKAHSRHKIVQYGLGKLFPDDRFFPTLRAAVSACREELGERWVGFRDEEQDLKRREEMRCLRAVLLHVGRCIISIPHVPVGGRL
jgi:hypothetical protein